MWYKAWKRKISQKGGEEGNYVNFHVEDKYWIILMEIYELADHVFQFEERGIFPHWAEKKSTSAVFMVLSYGLGIWYEAALGVKYFFHQPIRKSYKVIEVLNHVLKKPVLYSSYLYIA